MTSVYHTPVLLEESVRLLDIDPAGTYVDLTFGGGGHSRRILSALGDRGRLYAFDQDRDTRDNCPEDSRFHYVESNFRFMRGALRLHGVTRVDGILADLGCGTGDLTLMLTQAGYDVIGIDRSEEMLSVLREKADELGLTGRLLLLKQDLLDLDLYGTIRAAVSTFDTYSHIGPQDNFEKAIRQAAYFMERGGVFIFDLNTPYKHRHILAGQTFDIEAEDADCHWSNRYDETAQRVDITINIDYHETGEHFHEAFSEYSYALDTVCALLEKYGFAVAKVADGESFGPVRGDSPRWIITAVKQYTQEEKANGTES